jgi:hypothetical protein
VRAFFHRQSSPVALPPEVPRLEQVIAEIHENARQQQILDRKLKDFRHVNFALVGGALMFQGEHIGSRQRLEAEWRSMLVELAKLDQVRSRLLAEYAELRCA